MSKSFFARSGALVLAVLTGSSADGLSAAAQRGAGEARQSAARPERRVSERHDTSRPLRDMPLTAPARRTDPDEREPRFTRRIVRGRGRPDSVVQRSLGASRSPSPSLTTEGVGNVNAVLPPDTNAAVGPNHYVHSVNVSFAIYSKGDASTPPALIYGPTETSTIWTGFGGPCEARNDGDAIILYDHLADRWVMSQLALPNIFFGIAIAPFYQCVAVSATNDPTGAYHRYQFAFNKLNDYPKLAVWPDAYYMTTNQFFLGGSFNGAGAYAFQRAKMLVGDATAAMIYFNLDFASHPEGIGGLLPADLDGVSAPPAGAPNVMAYFTANEFGEPADALRLFNFHADFAVPANSTFLERPGSPLAVAAFNPITPSGQDDIPQPPPSGASSMLDALGDRLMFRLQYRNRGGFESLVVDHTVDADATAAYRAGVRYYELRNGAPGGVYAVNEQATFSPDATHRWMGSAAIDHQGNLAVGFSVSSAALFPSIRYAGRLTTDPPNGLFQGEATLIAGSGVQTSTNSRWGDYSALTVDPVDDCTFWFTTEYYTAASQASSSVGWLTRVGSFKYPSCTPRATGTLVVNVTTCSGGTPVQNALVKVNSALWGATGTGGSFTAKLDPGVYNLNAEKSGVGTGSNSATIIAGNTTTSNICLGGGGGGTVDLTVTAMTAKGKAAAGAAVAVKYTIANSGTSASVATTTHVYRSSNPTWDAGDLLIGTDATAPVPAGGSVTDTVTANIPGATAPGIYYLIVFADGGANQPETDENNNTRSKKISIGPDLSISSLSINPGSVAAGGSITINETTKNIGAQSTGAGSTTSWYLSLDKKVNAGDTLLDTHAVPTLGANGTHSKSGAVTIPAGKPPGQYWILAAADSGGAIAEVKETNTKAVALTIF